MKPVIMLMLTQSARRRAVPYPRRATSSASQARHLPLKGKAEEQRRKEGKDMDGNSRVTDLRIFNPGEMLPDGTPIEFGECMACEAEIAPEWLGSFGRYPRECPECGRMFIFERWVED